ncbi:mitochondrial 2-enoyl thioester reductase [Coemansia sp. RSA 1199]|nr:mitochondrial 2-enoyl thioester reductase [Coemansia sp. RSA 1199]
MTVSSSVFRVAARRAQNLGQVRGIQALAAVYTETGDPQSVLRVVRHDLPPMLDNQVMVQMLAAPVNPSDLNQIEGTYPVRGTSNQISSNGTSFQACVGGNEGVGRVAQVGQNVDNVQVGDWVVPQRAGEFGTWCTRTVVDAQSVSVVPEEWRSGLSPLDVACLKVNPCTAYRLLRDFADLQKGDYVIQNGANSGVGRAVIQLARHWGIRTINVVRDRPELDKLQHELTALGADIVVSDKQLSSDSVKQHIRSLDARVRLGFNCVGGRSTLQLTKYISEGGTLVSYGGMSRQPVTMPTSLLLFKDIAARGFWMNRWYNSCTNTAMDVERQNMWKCVLELMQCGMFVTQPLSVSSIDEANEADAQRIVRDAVSWSTGSKHAFVFA